MKSDRVLLGIIAGIAVGAILGILFAPEKGTKLRETIVSKGEDYAEGLKEKFHEILDNITEHYEEASQEAKDLVSKGKAKYEEVKKDVKNTTV
ncbi:MAG: YtxH domain-containing protein [Bacteroidota bacterium]|nr:YtxH domain-containing protein [Bacteroidota bacterium]